MTSMTLKKINLLTFKPTLTFCDLELELPLEMTLNHKNNTINGFFHSKSHEKKYDTCSQFYLFKNDIFTH